MPEGLLPIATLAEVVRARAVAQLRWEQVARVRQTAIAADNKYKRLLYQFYHAPKEVPHDDRSCETSSSSTKCSLCW